MSNREARTSRVNV